MKEIKAPVIVVAVVAIVAVLLYFGLKASSTGDLDQGQVQYTPGKPPWDDPLKKGSQTTPQPGGGPPGMTSPTRSAG